MHKLIYLTGSPASGKSSLSSQIQKERAGEVVVFEYGKELTKYLKEKGVQLDNQTELRQKSSAVVTQDDINTLDARLLDFAQSQRSTRHVIIDSHAVTKEAYGFRILPFSIEQIKVLNPSKIVVLYAESEVIIKRISENNQGRPLISSFEADMHTFLQAAVAINYGMNLHVPVYYLDSSRSPAQMKANFLRLLDS
jgi:adenylate kinase